MKYLSYIVAISIIISCTKIKNNNSTISNVKSTMATVTTPSDKSFGVVAEMAKIVGGSYIPLYGRDSQQVKINDFYIDVYPVTNENYKSFIDKNTRWRKSNVKGIFADKSYLTNWANDTSISANMNPNSPITNISWYAANAYCECQGKRLPTVDEWEFVAMADKVVADARKKKVYNQSILDWYEKPNAFKNTIGNTERNFYGVYDMHGLVWEWTSDFSSILLTGESRNDVTTDKDLFCGSGSINATDLMNYAAFIRYAFRSSIKANYSVQNLGFRCVSDSIITLK